MGEGVITPERVSMYVSTIVSKIRAPDLPSILWPEKEGQQEGEVRGLSAGLKLRKKKWHDIEGRYGS